MSRYSPFERRLRTAARLALYGSLLVLAVAAAALFHWSRRPLARGEDVEWRGVDFAAFEDVRLLQEYLRIDTTHATGSVVEGARFLARELEAMGLAPRLERLGDEYANVWAILEGERPEALVLHSHIDVWPPGDLAAWDHPPFSGAIEGPFLYGRGAFDMKSLAVAQLLALRDLAASGRRPRRSIVFLATGSEEEGSELGTQWVLREHPELVSRFWTVLTEGGVVEPVSVERVKYWGIEFAQKQFAYGWACAADRERLEQLRADIWAWQREVREPRLVPAVREFLAAYGSTRQRPRMRNFLTRQDQETVDPRRLAVQPPYLRSLFLDELDPFPVEPDPGGGWRMRLIVHLLPGSDLAAVRARLLPEWMTHGVAVTLGEAVGTTGASALDHEAYRALAATVRRARRGAPAGPYFLAWSATDARFFRGLGIPAYGFSPFPFFNLESLRADRENERINLPAYLEGLEIYRRAVRRLAG